MAKTRDDVRADPSLGEPPRQLGRKPDGIEAGVRAKADPRPLTGGIRPDDRHGLLLPDQSECVVRKSGITCICEAVPLRRKFRIQRLEEPREIVPAFQS